MAGWLRHHAHDTALQKVGQFSSTATASDAASSCTLTPLETSTTYCGFRFTLTGWQVRIRPVRFFPRIATFFSNLSHNKPDTRKKSFNHPVVRSSQGGRINPEILQGVEGFHAAKLIRGGTDVNLKTRNAIRRAYEKISRLDFIAGAAR